MKVLNSKEQKIAAAEGMRDGLKVVFFCKVVDWADVQGEIESRRA